MNLRWKWVVDMFVFCRILKVLNGLWSSPTIWLLVLFSPYTWIMIFLLPYAYFIPQHYCFGHIYYTVVLLHRASTRSLLKIPFFFPIFIQFIAYHKLKVINEILMKILKFSTKSGRQWQSCTWLYCSDSRLEKV